MIYLVIILSILGPRFNLSEGITVAFIDFLPLLFIMYLFSYKRTKLYFSYRMQLFLFLVLFLFFPWTLSTMANVILYQDFFPSIKSLLQLYRRFISIIIIPLFVFSLKERCNINNIIKKILILLIITAIIGELINVNSQIFKVYMEYIANSKQTFSGSIFRNMGFIGEPSYFAVLLVSSLFSYVFLYKNNRNYIYIVLTIIAIISTFSKSLFLSLIIVFITFLIFYIFSMKITIRKKDLVRGFLISFSLFFIFIFIFIFIYKTYYSIIIQYFINLAELSFQTRVNIIWKESINLFLSNNFRYFFGLGMKGLKSYYGIEGVHNNYLAFIVDFGIIGGIISILILYVLIPYIIFKNNTKSIKTFVVAVTLLLSLLSFVHEPYYHPTILAFIFFLYAILLKCNYYNSECKNEKSISS